MENRGRLKSLVAALFSRRENMEFHVVRRGGLVWYVRRNFTGPDLDELLDDPDTVVDERGTVLRDKGMSKTAAAGGFVIKRNPARKGSDVFKSIFRRSPALRAFLRAFQLEAAGVRTAVPVAASEKRGFRVLSSSFFVMEARQNAVTLNQWDGEPSDMAIRLGRLIGRLHAMKYSHRDLKAGNILVDSAGEPFLIDMEGVRFWWYLPVARVRRDLERLERTARALGAVEAVHRSLFVLAYCRERGIPPTLLRRGSRSPGIAVEEPALGRTPRIRWIEANGSGRRGLWVLFGPRSIDVRSRTRARRRVKVFEKRTAWFEVVRPVENGSELIWKWIRPDATPIDYWRRFWGRSRAARQIRGIELLRRGGLSAPRHYSSGFAVNPFSEYESFVLLDYREGTVSGHILLRESRDRETRSRFLRAVASDVNNMLRNGYVLRDLHFGNVLVDPNTPDRVHWIDCETTWIRSAGAKRKWRERAINRLITKARRNGLKDEEERIFLDALDGKDSVLARIG